MFREIHKKERNLETIRENKKEEGYKKIKPEKELSMDEINLLCMQMFIEAAGE